MGGLRIAKGKAVAADLEGDGIAQRRTPQHLDRSAVAEAHFEQSAADFGGPADFHHFATAADAQLIERTGGRGADVGASSEVASLFHDQHLTATAGGHPTIPTDGILVETEFQRNLWRRLKSGGNERYWLGSAIFTAFGGDRWP